MRKYVTTLLVCLVGTVSLVAPIGSANAKPKTKPVPTKRASKKPAANALRTDPSDPLVVDVGPLNGSASQIREVLVSKWGFPSWWPAVDGKLGSVTDYRGDPFAAPGSPSTRTVSEYLLIGSSRNADQVSDQITPPPGFRRGPMTSSNSGVPSTNVEFVQGNEKFVVVAFNNPVNGYFLVALSSITVISDLMVPALPTRSLTQYLPSISGNVISVGLSVGQIRFDPTIWKLFTPYAGVTVQYVDVPDDALAQFVARKPAGFSVVDKTDASVALVGSDPFQTSLSMSAYRGAGIVLVGRKTPTLLPSL